MISGSHKLNKVYYANTYRMLTDFQVWILATDNY